MRAAGLDSSAACSDGHNSHCATWKRRQTRKIWQQSQVQGKLKPPKLLSAQTTAPTEVDTTLKTMREILKLLHVLHPSWRQGWGAAGEGARIYAPKEDNSLKWCREEEHKQELLAVMRRQ